MAEKIGIDSDAGSQSQIGVGKVDQTNKAIQDLKPNWVEDGYGIVGPQRLVVRPDQARPRPMDFGNQSTDKNVNTPQGLTVQTRDGGGFGMIIQQVDGVTTITFDSAVFLIQDNGGGEVVVYCAT